MAKQLNKTFPFELETKNQRDQEKIYILMYVGHKFFDYYKQAHLHKRMSLGDKTEQGMYICS